MATQAFLAIMRLERVVAIATAAATGRRTLGPSAINTPTAMPAAGQKMATPSLARRARPRRAAMK